MREPLRDPARLEHMLDAISSVQGFMKGKTPRDLEDDRLLMFGVVKGLEIVGEAAYKITTDFKSQHPLTPWGMIIGLRHVLVHGYYQVRPKEICLIVKNDLPLLKSQIEAYLKEFDN